MAGMSTVAGQDTSAYAANSSRKYVINMNVNIERATPESAAALAKTIKRLLENDSEFESAGRF